MSLLIKGMNMPRHMTMRDYTLRVRQDGTTELIDRATGKSYDVIDVPSPHGRLIDADDIDNTTVVCTNRGTLKRIDAPTIIEAEV